MKTKMKQAVTSKWFMLAIGSVFVTSTVALASPNSTMNQTISNGSKSVDIVDAGGTPVASPSVTFNAQTFSFSAQTPPDATLGTAGQKIRIGNPTNAAVTVSIAAPSAATVWTDGGSNTYDFNDTNSDGTDNVADTDTVGGQLTVKPASATITKIAGNGACSTSAGSNYPFVEGTRDSIDLMTSSANFCQWDMTGVGLSQVIPAGQAAASYTLSLSLTIV